MNTDVPFLVGLGFLDKYNMYVNDVSNRLACEKLDMKIPILRKRGNMFIQWSNMTKYYTEQVNLSNFIESFLILHLISS